jgi:hypothetical protein
LCHSSMTELCMLSCNSVPLACLCVNSTTYSGPFAPIPFSSIKGTWQQAQHDPALSSHVGTATELPGHKPIALGLNYSS